MDRAEDWQAQLRRRLRELRHQAGWTISDLAERANLPRGYVYDMEQGRRFSVRNLRAVATALEVSADYLLGLTDEPSRTSHHTHTCCRLVAEADAWLQAHMHHDDAPHASRERWLPFWARLAGSIQKILPHENEERSRIELIECGIYRLDGRIYRRGDNLPSDPALLSPPVPTSHRTRGQTRGRNED